MHDAYHVRDLWQRRNLSVTTTAGGHRALNLSVPAHGVRMLRLWPAPPPSCPSGFEPHASGYWANPSCAHGTSGENCTRDHANGTLPACGEKCIAASPDCVAFEVFDSGAADAACYLFLQPLTAPFTPNSECFTCVRRS
jgi:hypothetical protein